MNKKKTVLVLLLALFSLTSSFAFSRNEYQKHEIKGEKGTYPGYRNYANALDGEQFEDLRFILKTLAQKTLVSLLGYKSQLESAGDRIDNVHPLRFLEGVFVNEELKTYFQQIKKRGGWVWSDFSKGLKGSLQEESSIGNLPEDYISDFASNVKIDPSLINKQIREAKWDEFIKTLIQYVPREGDHERYDQ